jgi:hypothetical protein
MIVKIQEEITDATLDKIIDAYNNLGSDEGLFIYLNSNGGLTKVTEAILDIINRQDNAVRTTLIGYGELGSSAFHLFYSAKCDRELTPGCHGLYHQSSMSVDMNENGRPSYTYSKFQEKYLKNFCKKATLDFCNDIGIIGDQLALIKRGKDVWFQPHEMQQFLVNSNLKNLDTHLTMSKQTVEIDRYNPQ